MHCKSVRYRMRMGSEHSFSFKVSNALWQAGDQTKGSAGNSMTVRGRAIFEKFGMKVRKYRNTPINFCSSLKVRGGKSARTALDFSY
jgi:hypothetical protein